MKLLIALTLLAVSHARIIKPGCANADVVSINNINYDKELLKDNVDSPYQMAIDYDTNTLFFSYTANTEDVFKSVSLNLKTNKYRIIPGINGGFAAAVDKINHKVYLGGRDGIYEYDYATQQANQVMKGPSIWQMFAKDKLYYTAYPDERVYTVEKGNEVIIPELNRTMVLLVALDNRNNMYYTNSSGLFYYNILEKKISLVGEYTVINGFTADINGNLYFSTPSALYKIEDDQLVNKLVEIDDVYGLVVDGDNNFIYGAGDKIIRLKPTKKLCSKVSQFN